MGRSMLRGGEIFGLVPSVEQRDARVRFFDLGGDCCWLDLSLLSGTLLRTCALLARGYLAGLST